MHPRTNSIWPCYMHAVSVTHIYTFSICVVCLCVHMRVMSGVLCVWLKYVRVRNVYKIGIPVYHLPNTRQPCQASPKNTQYGLLFVGGCANVRRSLSLTRSLSFEHTQSFSVSFSLSCPLLLLRVLSRFSHCIFDSKKFFFIYKKRPWPFCLEYRCMVRDTKSDSLRFGGGSE
jgi:hypothetical protein